MSKHATWQEMIAELGGDPDLYEQSLGYVPSDWDQVNLAGDAAQRLSLLAEMNVIEMRRIPTHYSNGELAGHKAEFRRPTKEYAI